MTPEAWKQSLTKGAQKLSVDLTSNQVEQCFHYCQALAKWNQAINLTAVRKIDDMLSQHVLDSLSVLPLLRGARCLDVGTGAGLPGVMLAIARPDMQFTLVDSVGKKIRFIQQIVHELKCSNIVSVHTRAENFSHDALFDVIISRAVSTVSETLENTAHLMANRGRWVFMKGPDYQKELENASGCLQRYQQSNLLEVIPLTVPGLSAKRIALLIENNKGN